MNPLRVLFAVAVVAAATMVLQHGGLDPRSAPGPSTASCESAGPSRTAFPAPGSWSVVNQQVFDVQHLPSSWYPFQGYYDGGSNVHDSLREPSMLAFPGSWMEFKNQVYSDGPNGSYHTIADAGVGGLPETYDAATSSDQQGYDDASETWGFQWCTRFNGGPGFDTAFAFVPTNGAWPPEIDFIEHGPRDGNTVTLHIHWKATKLTNDGDHCDQNDPTTNSQNSSCDFPQIKLVVGRWETDNAVTWSSSG